MSDSNSSSASDPSSTPSSEPAAGSPANGAGADAAVPEGDAPKKRRRRRRRGGKNKKPAAATGSSAPAPTSPAPTPALDPSIAALAGGLLSHIDDREVPCSVDGCKTTWVWTAAEQVAAYGQSPPRRECAACASTSAMEMRCSVDGCKRTWSWSREAQIKHRAWTQRRSSENKRGGKRRRRGDGPPRRKCDLCQKKYGTLAERPSVCRVHGCSRPVVVDRDAQLRSWAGMGSTDLSREAPLAKQMCDVCREFCRTHDDRAIACGRPGCEKSWTYKRGAQLQAFLAGRFEDPIRLCGPCERETRSAGHVEPASRVEADVEIMPCIVPGCTGVWHHRPGRPLPPCKEGELPVERMCNHHRAAHGAPPRNTESAATAASGRNAPPKTSAPAIDNVDGASAETGLSDPQEEASASEPIS
ncbi:MAG: hypothetical protein AAGA54_09625 [Myxococcota bacterium]